MDSTETVKWGFDLIHQNISSIIRSALFLWKKQGEMKFLCLQDKDNLK